MSSLSWGCSPVACPCAHTFVLVHETLLRPAEPTSYPYNKKVVFPPSPNPKPVPQRLLSPKKGWAVVRAHDEAARRLRDPQNLCGTLFSRRHPDRLRAGSILTVTTYTNMAKEGVSSFSGVLMGVKRTGSDYSFRLRNIVNKVGVEVQYKVLSPLIKEIKVVRKAMKNPKLGEVKALRQAQAYYLRDRPDLLKNLAGVLKQDRVEMAKQRDRSA
jgi:large subunit ribosomal protein L19